MTCRVYLFGLLAASCSNIFAMDAPPATLQESRPVAQEMPKQALLCDQWLDKTPTLSDGEKYDRLFVDSKGFLYILQDEFLTIWQAPPLSLLDEDVTTLKTSATYLGLLPREIVREAYKRMLAYKEFDPANYRCVASIKAGINPYDNSFVINSQGTIYVALAKKRTSSLLSSFFFKNEGKLEIYQKSDPMNPASYRCVARIECDGNFDRLKEQQGILFFIFLSANKIDIWKKTNPEDLKSYQHVASCIETELDTDDIIRVSSSGLIYSVNKFGQIGIWQRTYRNNSSSYKRVALYEGNMIDTHIESDDLLRSIFPEMKSELNELHNNAEEEKRALARNTRLISFIKETRAAKIKEEKKIAIVKSVKHAARIIAAGTAFAQYKMQIESIPHEAEARMKRKSAEDQAKSELAALEDRYKAALKEKSDALKAFEDHSAAEAVALKAAIADLKERFEGEKAERKSWWDMIVKAYDEKISSFPGSKWFWQ